MKSISKLNKFLEINPDDKYIKFILGKAYKNLKMKNESITYLSQALGAEDNLDKFIYKNITDVSQGIFLMENEIEKYINFAEALNYKNKGDKNNSLKLLSDLLGKTNFYFEKTILNQIAFVSSIDDFKNIKNNEKKVSIINENEISDNVENILTVLESSNITYINNILEPKKNVINFSDVGGLEDLKKTITMKIIKPFQSPEIFSKFKKKTGGGILLYGPPGCGKTYIAKATSGECNSNFLNIEITDIVSPFFGESEQNVKNIFAKARNKKPCVIFIDELENLGYSRSKAASERTRNIVGQLLTEIEGIDNNTDKLLIIGATNLPWSVDDAFRRPGRFDRSIFVGPPDKKARETIFKLKLNGRPCKDINYKHLAELTNLFSGADIEYVIETASEKILEKILETENKDLFITQKTILEAIENTKPSVIGWLRNASMYIKYANLNNYYDDLEKFIQENINYL